MWSSDFLDQINSRMIRPRWVLEAVEGVGFEPVPGALKLSSHREVGYSQLLSLDGNRLSAGRVEPETWSQTFSELTLGLRLAVDIRGLIARGQLVVYRMGFAGWALDDYQPIFYGHVQSLDRSGDAWSITIRSLVSTISSRLDEDGDGVSLFHELGESTLDLQYLAVAGAGPASVTVVDASDADHEALGSFLLQIFPDSGDPFFVRATGLAGDVFTVDTAPLFGADAETAAIGNRVIFCAYVQDSPVNAVHKLLVSTGTGLNDPAHDTLPELWGIGVPEWVVDADDIDLTQLIVDPPGAGMVWDIYSTETQADALSWFQGILAPAGMVLCERQGLLTIRAASPSYDRPYGIETATDLDLISFDRQETWSSSQPIEYWLVFVVHPDSEPDLAVGALGEQLDSRPGGSTRVIELDYVSDNDADWRDSVVERLGPWSLRLAEIVEIRCAGLRFAALAPFDSLVIDSRHFTPRDGAVLPTLMVLSVEPDWWNGTVRIVGAAIPEDASEF